MLFRFLNFGRTHQQQMWRRQNDKYGKVGDTEKCGLTLNWGPVSPRWIESNISEILNHNLRTEHCTSFLDQISWVRRICFVTIFCGKSIWKQKFCLGCNSSNFIAYFLYERLQFSVCKYRKKTVSFFYTCFSSIEIKESSTAVCSTKYN